MKTLKKVIISLVLAASVFMFTGCLQFMDMMMIIGDWKSETTMSIMGTEVYTTYSFTSDSDLEYKREMRLVEDGSLFFRETGTWTINTEENGNTYLTIKAKMSALGNMELTEATTDPVDFDYSVTSSKLKLRTKGSSSDWQIYKKK